MSTTLQEEISGWGRHPVTRAALARGEDLERLSADAVLSRGLGRAYGDAALPTPDTVNRPVALTTLGDRLLHFDPDTGVLRAEAGLSLGSLRKVLMARGWFTPVSPGTRFVTLGGMVASDIHGKNHHVAGTFGRHVRALRMRTGDGQLREVTRESEPELFAASLGGMGLTGHILEVEVALERLPSAWIYEETDRYATFDEVIHALDEASRNWPMTVAWIDTSTTGRNFGRGIVMRGRWATASEAPNHPPPVKGSVRLPFDFPSGLANPHTFRLLNALWYLKHGGKHRAHVIHPESFFWVLDSIGDWNRVFGRRGFTQYQCVLPRAELYRELLEIFQRMGGCSFVTVLKDCGEAGEGMLSFPQPGTSLALDIPMSRGPAIEQLCMKLNEFVIANGGRIYLAKDAFTTAEQFAAMYPRLPEFMAVRRRYDPEQRIRSAQAARVGLL